MISKCLTAFASVLLLSTSVSALATPARDSNWLVRVRAVHMDMSNKSSPIPALGVQDDEIHVENRTIPEVDISYFFTPQWAAELVLTVPQKHEVTLEQNGTSTSLGSFKHLPPTLLLQRHFNPQGKVRPYIGAGVNYTKFSSVKLAAGALPLTVKDHSIGAALGAGFDIALNKNLVFNLDVKKLQLRTDVLASGQTVSNVKADPLLIGVGLGWKF